MFSSFASDNFSPVHPEVMDALQKANIGHAMAYGADPWTEKMQEIFKNIFGPFTESFLVFNGTAANVCSIEHALLPWQAVMCSSNAHIWNDECGAPQANTGSSLLPIEAKNGKISPEQCEKYLHGKGDPHHVQPALLSITQSTELGTVYTLQEMKNLADFAHRNNLLLHVDGARLCNAAAHLKVSLKDLTTDVGVDLLSFGGTKNGLMGAEAVVFLKEGLAQKFKYVQKQQMQLASKMRFASAQMIALFEGDLWLRNASHANKMAKLLEENLKHNFPELPILYPVEANAVFVQLPSLEILEKLQQKSFFWIWDNEQLVARWMTSWDTQPAFIESFLTDLKHIVI
ncbi:MAG: threonine aldolase [Chlamydiae bacterium CG10_big_fil_rev_8_21_14_0_10_35_9]|nr:MAG: threonine aldolase [Chlamydiae bacterium CG10_big_fil_rev_8_21_14_0_10_35_9]